MKLKVPESFTGQVTDADGKTYAIASDGTVDIPADKVTYNHWGYGFVAIPQPTASKASNN